MNKKTRSGSTHLAEPLNDQKRAGSDQPLTNEPAKLWTGQFIMLCVSSLLFFLSFNLIIAELPHWLEILGNKKMLPFIIPLFTLAALISRPLSGHLADTIGRRPIIVIGILVSGICALIYPLMLTVTGFLTLRFFHGFSTGFTPTGTTAVLTDIIAPDRRGEGMGILGMSGSVGLASGPALGSLIATNFGHEVMFRSASLFALLSLILVFTIKETLPSPKKFRLDSLKIPASAIYEPRVFMPSLMALLLFLPFGVLITVIPDKSDLLGISNRGLFFAFYVTTSILIRFPAGKFSDQIGRASLTMVASLIIGTAMLMVSFAETEKLFLTAAALGGVGAGISSPILFAWTADLANEAHRARAFSTTFMALEIGIGGGGLIGGTLYGNMAERIHLPFLFAALACFLAAGILLVKLQRRKRKVS